MMAFLFLIAAVIACAGIGRATVHVLRTVPEDRTERVVVSCAVGLGVAAYLILAVGLLGWLRVAPTLTVLGLAVVASFRGFGMLARDLVRPRVSPMAADISVGEAPADAPAGDSPWMRRACVLALIAVGAVVAVNCFVPPGAHEWDALAYHLAAPKVYLQHERIVFLPTDHHSNFPFLLQMLFTLGLMLDGYALANLFHATTGALTCAALVAIGRRHFRAGSGWIAAAAFAVAPIAVWEAGAAYIEHSMALYVLLAVGAALEYRRSAEARWLGLAGILMGFALGTKTIALIPAFALGIVLIATRVRFKQLRWYLLGALVAGCPFYVKSWAWTGDPVYPFGYRIFHGRYWSEDPAEAYKGEQSSFGLRASMLRPSDDWKDIQPGPKPQTLSDRVRNVVLAPFALVSVPRIFYNYNDPGAFTHLGFLFLALPPLLLVAPRAEGGHGAAGLVAAVAILWYLVWSQTMQYVRYLLPLLPLALLLGGEGVRRTVAASKLLGVLVVFAIGFQVWLTLRYFGGQIPVRLEVARDAAARDAYLQRQVNHYEATEWLNRNTPREAGVVLFEETRGFYLDRPYLWGNYYHSRFIPYENMHGGRDMADWFLSNGIRYALVNLRFSHIANSSRENQARMNQAIAANEEAGLMLEWYGNPDALGGESWRRFLGEAIREGGAVVINEASRRGVVVLEFRPSRPGITGNAREVQAGRGVK